MLLQTEEGFISSQTCSHVSYKH